MLQIPIPLENFNAITDGRQTALVLKNTIVETGSVLLLVAEPEDKRETYVIVQHCFKYEIVCIASIKVSIATNKGSSRRMEAVTVPEKGENK